jgi:hypothetical protein
MKGGTMPTKARRDRYIELRKYMSQTDARGLAGIPRTTAWRIDRSAGLDSPKGPKVGSTGVPKPERAEKLEKPYTGPTALEDPAVIANLRLTSTLDAGGLFDDGGPAELFGEPPDDPANVADVLKLEIKTAPEPRLDSHPFGELDPMPASHPASSRASYVVGSGRRIGLVRNPARTVARKDGRGSPTAEMRIVGGA